MPIRQRRQIFAGGGRFLPFGKMCPAQCGAKGQRMQLLTQLLNPITLAAMLLGCALVAMVQNGPGALWRALSALSALWRSDPERDMTLARATMNRVDHVAQLRGLQCTDRVRAGNSFLAMAIRKLADTETVDRFEIWAEQALSDRRSRHEKVHKVWLSVADAAPGASCS